MKTATTAPAFTGTVEVSYVRLAWAGAVVVLAIVVAGTWWNAVRLGFAVPPLGIDLGTYTDAARRFLSGGPFYDPRQLAGPYDLWGSGQPILYPPTAIPLFAAFTVLPGVLWWAIPALIVGAVTWHHRPRPLALAAMALLIAWPTSSVDLIWTGNPAMWVVALLALATINPAFGPWVLLKPSLAPFALWGLRDRRWLVGLAAFGILSLAFLPLWRDYVVALGNAKAGLLYSLWNVPLMLVPVVGWLGRR